MFKIPNIVVKDTPIVERPRFEYVHVDELVEFKFVPLAKLVDTTNEKLVDDLVASVK
jgi:hypothetical protein